MKRYLDYKQASNSNLSLYYYIHILFKKIEFALLILICLSLIFISKTNETLKQDISNLFINISLPISQAISYPFNISTNVMFNLKELQIIREENIILKLENEKLKSFYINAINIKQENKELQDLLKFSQLRSVNYKAVRLLAKPDYPHSNNIFINSGSKQGLKENSVVVSGKSMIGRIIEVSNNYSRVLTIYDENSKIPAITSNSRQKGILIGTGTKMKIKYLDKDHNIQLGDMVFTSGDGGYLPPGLLIGIVTDIGKKEVSVKAIDNPDNINLAVIMKY